MSLSDFVRGHHEEIISEFTAFARTLMPAGAVMSDTELRDHADELLTAVVKDIGIAQTGEEQSLKSRGGGAVNTMGASAQLHADDRIQHGFTFRAVLAEFRALRATVLRLYEESGATDLREVRRFNEAIDEALTESMDRFAYFSPIDCGINSSASSATICARRWARLRPALLSSRRLRTIPNAAAESSRGS